MKLPIKILIHIQTISFIASCIKIYVLSILKFGRPKSYYDLIQIDYNLIGKNLEKKRKTFRKMENLL